MTEDVAVKMTELEQRCKSNAYRLDKLEARQDDLDKLVASVTALANEQEHIKDDVTEIKADVKTLTEKPGKRWDSIVDKLIWGVLGAVLAFLMTRIGIA